MRITLAATLIALGIACATHEKSVTKTQIITFPQGALVQYQGHALGRAPVSVVLPQDDAGHLTQRAEIRAVPNSNQPRLYAETRVLEPETYPEGVPNRIVIDLTLRGTNAIAVGRPAPGHVEASANATTTADSGGVKGRQTANSPKRRPIDRGKPTQAIGLDRWNPGIY